MKLRRYGKSNELLTVLAISWGVPILNKERGMEVEETYCHLTNLAWTIPTEKKDHLAFQQILR